MNTESLFQIYQSANNVVIDSRKIEKGDLFFAFSGEKFNAALFAKEAIAKGAVAVIIEQKEYEDLDQNIYYVPSTLVALQDLARYHRNQLKIPIIGLTGSNGKTTTKELIHAVLSAKYNVQFTKGNLNNHIGVPLTLLSIRDEHQMAVIEMGANHQKEIEFLCNLAQPDIGYITNFGKAHLEGFGGVEGVIKGKSELYDFLKSHHNTILVNDADAIQVEKTSDYQPRISFGTEGSDYYYQIQTQEHFVGLSYQGVQIISQLTGAYNFNNISAAVSLGLHFDVKIEKVKSAIENYSPSNMRSQMLQRNGQTLVLDTYNANPSSMLESLKNFITFEGSKTIIIGDMLELGAESEKEHQELLAFAQSLGFDEIISVGPKFMAVNPTNLAFDSSKSLIEYLKSHKISSKNILLKASRGIALEEIIDYLN